MPTESTSTSNVTSNITDVGFNLVFCTDRPVGPLVWSISCVTSGLVGVPASFWLLWVFVQKHRGGLTNDVFMFNLTIMDLIFNILLIPNVVNYYIWQNTQFSFTHVFFELFGLFGRPLVMTCICVDCYLAVIHPISYMKNMKRRYKMVACALVWIFTLAYGASLVYVQATMPTTVNSLYFVIPYSLCLLIIGLCDYFVLCALRKPDPSGRNTVHPQKQKAQQTIINSLVMSIVAYLPPLVSGCLQSLLPVSGDVFTCDIFIPCLIGPYLGSNIMPILYLGNLGKLKGMWAYIRTKCGNTI